MFYDCFSTLLIQKGGLVGKIKTLVLTYNKIFFKNKPLLLFSIVFPILFYMFFTLIFTNYDDIQKVPIGVIDQDQSQLSQKMLDDLLDHPSLSVETTSLSEADHMIKRNKIEAIFIIKPGFEDGIKASDYAASIQLVYLDKSNIGPALGDIFASSIISDLAIYKAANMSVLYEKRYGLEPLFEKTESMGYDLLESNTFEMTVISEVLKPGAVENETLDIQSILKSHTTFGFSLVVFSFIFLFANSFLIDNKALGIEKKLITLGYKSHELFLGQWLSLAVTGLFMTCFQIIFIMIAFRITLFSQIILILLTYLMHYLLLINITMLLTRAITSKNRYQSLAAPLIFILGLTGGAFWSVELLSDSFLWASNISPFYWSLKLLDGMMLTGKDAQLSKILLAYLSFNGIFLCINISFYRLHYGLKLKS